MLLKWNDFSDFMHIYGFIFCCQLICIGDDDLCWFDLCGYI